MSDSDVRSAGEAGRGLRADQPKRRVFSAEYKLAMVTAYDACTGFGERGALLRREGLYQSHIGKWRKARDRGDYSGSAAGTGSGSRPRVCAGSGSSTRQRDLERENARLAAELQRTQAVLDVVGKAHALLEMFSESTGTLVSSPRSS